MTDEDRQRLCEHLRRTSDLSMEAANEIERLDADNKRLKQERDAWERSCRAMGWAEAND